MKLPIHRKERVILTAIEIINDLGIQGLSTREIAKREDISEGTLFKHFKNKNEILLGVLEHYSQYDMDIIESIKLKKLPFAEAIKYFIDSYALYYENYPEITAITQIYEVLANDQNLAVKVMDIYNVRYKFMYDTIESAKLSGELSLEVDSIILSDTILGLFNAICLRWRFEKFSFSLQNQTMLAMDMILKCIYK